MVDAAHNPYRLARPRAVTEPVVVRSDVGRVDAQRLRCAGVTHRGRVRDGNEDALLMRPGRGLFSVADGLGGHNAGEVASAMALHALDTLLSDEGGPTERLGRAIEVANDRIYAAGRARRSQRGMATTIATLLVTPSGAWIAHVGDSRVYLLREGRMLGVTLDHSPMGDAIRFGLAPDALWAVPPNTVTRCVGSLPGVAVDVQRVELRRGDRFLLCSDGLTDELSDTMIEEILRDESFADDAACGLSAAALAAGGRDNVTVVVVDVEAG